MTWFGASSNIGDLHTYLVVGSDDTDGALCTLPSTSTLQEARYNVDEFKRNSCWFWGVPETLPGKDAAGLGTAGGAFRC